jgi:hypothetical protein
VIRDLGDDFAHLRFCQSIHAELLGKKPAVDIEIRGRGSALQCVRHSLGRGAPSVASGVELGATRGSEPEVRPRRTRLPRDPLTLDEPVVSTGQPACCQRRVI